jgi:hypothetical protein
VITADTRDQGVTAWRYSQERGGVREHAVRIEVRTLD